MPDSVVEGATVALMDTVEYIDNPSYGILLLCLSPYFPDLSSQSRGHSRKHRVHYPFPCFDADLSCIHPHLTHNLLNLLVVFPFIQVFLSPNAHFSLLPRPVHFDLQLVLTVSVSRLLPTLGDTLGGKWWNSIVSISLDRFKLTGVDGIDGL